MRPKAGHSMMDRPFFNARSRSADSALSASKLTNGAPVKRTASGQASAIEHPGRDLQPSLHFRSVKSAAEKDAIGLVDHRMDANLAASPGMKPIQNFSANGPVGVLELRCTTSSAHIRAVGATAKTPMQTFVDTIPLAREKMLNAA